MPVNTCHKLYLQQLPQWKRCRDVVEGSDAVKGAGESYLPALDSHRTKPAAYDAYKLRALFYNATGRTVEGLAGLIFQKPPTLKLTPAASGLERDVTLTGTTAETFGLLVTREVFTTGRYGILVDMDLEPGVQPWPYWCGYRTEQIVNWRVQRRAGRQLLTRVVLCEHVEEPDPTDRFGFVSVEQHRVLELLDRRYTVTLWRKKKVANTVTEEWVEYTPPGQAGPQLVPQRRGQPLDFIPFVFVGPTTVEPAPEKPPLLDLVEVNLSHYRTSADLEHGRHWTALPTPWVSGARGGDGAAPLAIGSGTAWELDTGGQAGMLEFTGQGLRALETADTDKRKLMATLGARLLEEQPAGPETLGAVAMRHAGEHATIRTIAETVETALTQTLRWSAWWLGTEQAPDAVQAVYELNKDYFTVKLTPQELQALVAALQAETISYQTFYHNITSGGLARPGVTAEQEQALIEGERPAVDLPPEPES